MLEPIYPNAEPKYHLLDNNNHFKILPLSIRQKQNIQIWEKFIMKKERNISLSLELVMKKRKTEKETNHM